MFQCFADEHFLFCFTTRNQRSTQQSKATRQPMNCLNLYLGLFVLDDIACYFVLNIF